MSPFGEAYKFFSGIGVSLRGPIEKIERVNILFELSEERVHGCAAALEKFGIALRQDLGGATRFFFESRLGRRERPAHVLTRRLLERPLGSSGRRGEFGTAAARDLRLFGLELRDTRPELAEFVVQVLRQLTGPVMTQ